MIDALRHHPWYRCESHCRPDLALARVSLGFVNTAPQPVTGQDGSLVVMHGELFDADDLRRELEAAGCIFRTGSHAEILLCGIQREGKTFLARLNGVFAAALWDARTKQLVLVNDRYGLKPLFYARLPSVPGVPGKLLFASEIKALLLEPSVSRKIRPSGLAQFFAFGHFLGEDTLWDGVHMLPAAGWLTCDARRGRVDVESYASTSVTNAAPRSEHDHLERIDHTFHRAVERRTRDAHLGLSLSGGLDARTILGSVDAALPLQTITMGIDGSIDHRAAAELARIVGRPHHRYVLNTKFLESFESHLRRMVHLTDGHYLSQCIVMPTLPIYRELGVEVLLRGHAGELMHMDKAYNFSLDADAQALSSEADLEGWLYRRLACYMSQELRDRLFAPAYHEQLQGLERESLRACLRAGAGIEPPAQRIARLFLSQRIRRETGLSMVKFGSVVETRLPYLDNDLVDALWAAPPSLKLGDRIQAFILKRRMPAFLNVVNANTGAPMGAGKLRQLLAKIKLKAFAKLGIKGYQPYERLGKWLREELRPLVQKLLLGPRFHDRGIFSVATVNEVVDGHLNKGENHTFLLMALMIFEVGQQQFVDEPRPEVVNQANGFAPALQACN